MTSDDLNLKSYLNELYRQTGGNTEAQVSMHDVGAAIGLDKGEASSLAEELMVQGQVELKTLAGGIGITTEGLAALGMTVATPKTVQSDLQFGAGPVAEDNDRNLVRLLTEEIKTEIYGKQLEFDLLDEIVFDLKSVELQLLSPKPKIAVVKELFRSLQSALEAAKIDNTAAKLKTIIG